MDAGHDLSWRSSRGLGRALAEAVLADGHQLVATARNPAQLADLVARYGDQVRAVALDVTDARAATHAIQAAVDAFGRLDVLVNNAGYGDVGSIEDTSDADFRAQIETNLFGVVNVTKAAIPLLREQRSGHIIQISSIGGRLGTPGVGAYQTATWDVEGCSEEAAYLIGGAPRCNRSSSNWPKLGRRRRAALAAAGCDAEL